jgi:thiamine-monophosphate kinase
MSVGEFDLIRRYFTRGKERGPGPVGVVLGIGDDAAVLQLPRGLDLVVAVDTIVAERHFLGATQPHSIGHRALAVNLSDLAAMGATPAWATLALTLPQADPQWLEGFSAGLFSLAEQHGVVLVGGDTTAGPLTVSIQVLGTVAAGTALRRGGARAGDLLVVTGSLGDAGAGLWLAARLSPEARAAAASHPSATQELIHRFDYPVPRVALGLAARTLASAAMDLSDGLVADAAKLVAASGLGAVIDVERLPLSPALQSITDPAQAREWALGAGDDYELLLAIDPGRLPELAAAAVRLDLPLTTIGELVTGSGVSWRSGGRAYVPEVAGWDHFR